MNTTNNKEERRQQRKGLMWLHDRPVFGRLCERLCGREPVRPLRHVALFVVILLGFHFLYSAIINDELMIAGLEPLYLVLRKMLYNHSAWVVESLPGIGITRAGDTIYFEGGGGILINESCSAVKWFAHFLVLMLIFPGPWKHKLWFIPAGLVVTHLINIVRVAGLSVVYVTRPQGFDFFHDYVFRPLFYLVLFLMWVLWVEVFYGSASGKKAVTGNQTHHPA